MDTKTIFAAVCLIGFGVLCSSKAYKTEEDIMLEIKSMVAGVFKECSRPMNPQYCYSPQKKVLDAKSLPILCSAMNLYIRCQEINCQNQTNALMYLLSDAVDIPYCHQMLNVPVEKDLQQVTSEVAAVTHLCSFLPGQNCDLYLDRVLQSKTLDRACIAQTYYVECLRLRCLETNNLTKQIEMTKSSSTCGSSYNHSSSAIKTEVDIMLEIRSMANAILTECTWSRSHELCDAYKNTLDQAKSLKMTCLAQADYLECLQLKCAESQNLTQQIEMNLSSSRCAKLLAKSSTPSIGYTNNQDGRAGYQTSSPLLATVAVMICVFLIGAFNGN